MHKAMENKNNRNELPLIPLRGAVLFPDMTLHFDVARKFSVAALKKASESGEDIIFVSQREIGSENPSADDLYTVGVVGTVRQIVRIPETGPAIRVVVQGKYKAFISDVEKNKGFFEASAQKAEDERSLPENFDGSENFLQEASLFSVRRFFDAYCEKVSQISPDIIAAVLDSKDIGRAADLIAGNIFLTVENKMELLSEMNVFKRAEKLCSLLAREIDILTLDEKLQDKVQSQIDLNQREYYLREELKAITEELNFMDGDDASQLLSKIENSAMPEQTKNKLLGELEKMKRMSPSSPEANVSRTYIEKCLELPWGKYTKENTDLTKAAKILEKEHYGLKPIKERVTEMLAALMVSPDIKGQILCLAGPPGVGKTSIAKSIAKASNRNYVRISLGGVHDEAEIRGHRKTYIGSMPGRIANAIIDAQSFNPLILLDEIDKMASDYRGDPASAMLEVLDGEQNFSFRDHYLEIPLDLSKALFITTANDKSAIPDALRDRMEILELPSYTYEEKFNIAKKHLIPKQLKEHGLNKSFIRISDSAIRLIIDGYTREAGVRVLERRFAAVCRKAAMRIASGNNEKLVVTDKNVEELLGPRKYRPDASKHNDEIGLVNGLAWTSVGGELLQAEVAVLEGTGKLELTGSLGDVMKESAKTAISFVRSRSSQLHIDPEFYKNKDIHIHFPEGAVPKDGPSAGVTVTTALVSALTEKKVSGSVAMTGEVTLRGRVLAIGGLREKAMAAYREGMKTVIIPQANVADLQEIDPAVKDKLIFVPVDSVDEVLNSALIQ